MLLLLWVLWHALREDRLIYGHWFGRPFWFDRKSQPKRFWGAVGTLVFFILSGLHSFITGVA